MKRRLLNSETEEVFSTGCGGKRHLACCSAHQFARCRSGRIASALQGRCKTLRRDERLFLSPSEAGLIE